MEICPNILVKEIVCPHTWDKFKDNSIKFLDKDLILCIDVVRNQILKKPIIINDGNNTQRGLRCNICEIPKAKTLANQIYLSQHLFGKAIDFTCKGFTIQQIHDLIIKYQDLLPCKIRLESIENAPTWCHIDVMCDPKQIEKVYIFKA